VADTVDVKVPAKVWWLLAERAETQGVTVAEYLAHVATSHVIAQKTGPRHTQGVTTSRVAELHALGLTDRDIAVRLSIGVQGVMYHRRKLRLAPNPGRTA
jgi:DNA-binding NarL/FixJ family response regulator